MASKKALDGARLLEKGSLEEAEEIFAAGLSSDPNDAECILGLARVKLARRDFPEAKGLLDRMRALHPNHLETLTHLARLSASEGAEGALETLAGLAGQPGAGFLQFFDLGLTLFERGRPSEAAAAFSQALEKKADQPQALSKLGECMALAGKLDEALRCFSRAAQLAPKEGWPMVLAGRVFVRQNRANDALRALEEALKREPSLIVARAELVQVYIFSGQFQKALREAMALRQAEPDNPQYIYQMGLVTLLLGNAAGARKIFEEGLSKAPTSWELKLALAKVAILEKKSDEAQRLLEDAVKLAPTEANPPKELSVLLLEKGNFAAAKSVLEIALQAHPDDAGLHLNLALTLSKSDPRRARTHAQSAARSPDAGIREQADRLLKALPTA